MKAPEPTPGINYRLKGVPDTTSLKIIIPSSVIIIYVQSGHLNLLPEAFPNIVVMAEHQTSDNNLKQENELTFV
jgi:hypothetical protein